MRVREVVGVGWKGYYMYARGSIYSEKAGRSVDSGVLSFLGRLPGHRARAKYSLSVAYTILGAVDC